MKSSVLFIFFQPRLDGLALSRGARCLCGLLCLPMLFSFAASALCFRLASYCQKDKWWSKTQESTELMSQAARPKADTIHCSITFQTLVLLLDCLVLVLFIGCLLPFTDDQDLIGSYKTCTGICLVRIWGEAAHGGARRSWNRRTPKKHRFSY